MSNDEKIPGNCNYPTTDGGYCSRGAIENGRCAVHAGANHDPSIKHGMYAQRQNYYEQCSDREQAWIDSVVASFLEDAPFEPTDFGKFQKLRNIAIDMHKVRNANDYIKTDGIQKEETVGVTDDGRPIKKDVEHELNVAVDRLQRSTTKQLKELGVLDDPDSAKAESQESIAKELSKINSSE